MRRSSWISIVLLTVLFHSRLLELGVFLSNSDYAAFELLGQDFAQWNWSAFCYQQDYGGNTFAVLRGLFLGISSLVTGQSIFSPGLTHFFTLVMSPLIIATAILFLLRQHVSKLFAFIVAALFAVGQPYLISHYGNDFYLASFVLSCALLAWRTRFRNPFLEFSLTQTFWAAALCALSIYTWKAGIIYVIVFWIPNETLKRAVRGFFRPKDWKEKTLLGLGLFFIYLWFLLQLLHGKVGTWDGKPIRLHAAPNAHLAAIVFLVLWLKQNFKILLWWTSEEVRKTVGHSIARYFLSLLGGFAFGFLPQLLYWIQHSDDPPTPGVFNQLTSFDEMVLILLNLPKAMGEYFAGPSHLQLETKMAWGPMGLMAIGLFFSLLSSKKEQKLRPAWMAAALSIFAFIQIKTYVVGPTRYLFPIFPALMVLFARGWEIAFQRLARPVNGLFLIGSCAAIFSYAWMFSSQLINQSRQVQIQEVTQAIVSKMKATGVRVVISNDYWRSNLFTVESARSPYFVSDGRPWGPELGFSLAQTENRVGILIREQLDKPLAYKGELLELYGRTWKLEKIGTVGALKLFVGTATSPQSR